MHFECCIQFLIKIYMYTSHLAVHLLAGNSLSNSTKNIEKNSNSNSNRELQYLQ